MPFLAVPVFIPDETPVNRKVVPSGSTARLECKTNLTPPVSYSWSKQGGILPPDSDFRQVTFTY